MREELAKTLFIIEYPELADWDWATIREHAPVSAARCLFTADSIQPYIEAAKKEERERINGILVNSGLLCEFEDAQENNCITCLQIYGEQGRTQPLFSKEDS